MDFKSNLTHISPHSLPVTNVNLDYSSLFTNDTVFYQQWENWLLTSQQNLRSVHVFVQKS